jgi:hypothetical protein
MHPSQRAQNEILRLRAENIAIVDARRAGSINSLYTSAERSAFIDRYDKMIRELDSVIATFPQAH